MTVYVNMFSLLLYPCFLCKLSSAAPLLIIMLESFRWDYLDIYGKELEALGRLASEGVRAKYMEPDFPSNPLTNEYTIMTGLYNEYHGMLSPDMYDPVRKVSMWDQERPSSFWWDNAEPIWIAAERQGKSSYLFDWRYCRLGFRGLQASYCGLTNPFEALKNNLKSGLDVLLNSTADLVGILIRDVEDAGHIVGPRSEEMRATMEALNNPISLLMGEIKRSHLKDKLNILLLSGNGMSDVSPKRVIRITDYVNQDDIVTITDGLSFLGVWPRPGRLNQVYQRLRSAHVNMTVYKKEDCPEHWHYRRHQRIVPILVAADKGWHILKDRRAFPTYESVENGNNKTHPQRGSHGYDNLFSDMWGTFIATGPAFKTSYKSGPIKAVDVYQVICKLLDIAPSPHNGSWDRVRDMFQSNTESSSCSTSSISFSLFFMSLLCFLFLHLFPETKLLEICYLFIM